jgi:hypothetical protein
MTRFVLLSFAFLGWAFYEVSGGSDFAPSPPARITAQFAAPEPEPVAAAPTEDTIDISEALAAQSQPAPEPLPIALVSAPAPTPEAERIVLTPSAEEAEQAAVYATPPADIREVSGSRVNMRSGPGTGFAVLATLSRGDRVEVLGAPENGWAKLRVVETGRIGWMSARLLGDAN